MIRKWIHRALKGASLTTALFVFQACYGSPPGLDYDLGPEEEKAEWTMPAQDTPEEIPAPEAEPESGEEGLVEEAAE